MILTVVFLCTAEYATKFISENVVILDRCPFELYYLWVQADRDRYEALLTETDGPMKEVISRVLSMFPQLGAVLALGDSAYEFVSSMVSAGQLSESNFPQEESSPHPQIHENKFTTLLQLRTTMADFIAVLEKATGLVAVGVPTKDDLNKIFTVSKVTPEERSRRSVQTRQFNLMMDYMASISIKNHIISHTQENDEVRARLDSMSCKECFCWLNDSGWSMKALKTEAKAVAIATAKAGATAKAAEVEANLIEEAIISADSEAESRRLDNMEESIDDDAGHGNLIQKSKRRNMTISK